MSNNLRSQKIADILNDSEKMIKIIQSGVNQALLQHKRMGNPICIWQNGKVVWIPPEKISVQNK